MQSIGLAAISDSDTSRPTSQVFAAYYAELIRARPDTPQSEFSTSPPTFADWERGHFDYITLVDRSSEESDRSR